MRAHELKRPGAAAFTVVELLVVVAIISVVLALLVPSLQQARVQGHKIACQSNLKHMYVASKMYMLNHKDRYLPAEYQRGNTGLTQHSNTRNATWWGTYYQRELMTKDYVRSILQYNGTSDNSVVTKFTGGGRCPTATDNYVYTLNYFSLGYNSYLGMRKPQWSHQTEALTAWALDPAEFRMPNTVHNYVKSTGRVGLVSEQDIRSTASTPVFFDARYPNLAPLENDYHLQALRGYGMLHPGLDGLNVVFVDGHTNVITPSQWLGGAMLTQF